VEGWTGRELGVCAKFGEDDRLCIAGLHSGVGMIGQSIYLHENCTIIFVFFGDKCAHISGLLCCCRHVQASEEGG
jgi:hypothetical protein